jgi:hypothetical protein
MQGIGRVTGGARTGAARGAARGGTGFSVAAGGGATAREASAAAEVAAPGLGLLALQEAGSGAERDAAAHRRASAILEELDGLQCELLGGGNGDPARLQRLAALESGEEGADPALREVVQGIVLRAKVELARRSLHAPATSA